MKIRPIRIEGELAYVTLSQNRVAIIDASDVALINNRNWCFNSGGYAAGRKNGIQERMHRVLSQTPDGLETDHINGNRLDNRRVNLRHATSRQNNYNTGSRPCNTSGHKGAFWDRKHLKWKAQITLPGKTKRHLGYFPTAELAAAAYAKAATELHGEFLRLGA